MKARSISPSWSSGGGRTRTGSPVIRPPGTINRHFKTRTSDVILRPGDGNARKHDRSSNVSHVNPVTRGEISYKISGRMRFQRDSTTTGELSTRRPRLQMRFRDARRVIKFESRCAYLHESPFPYRAATKAKRMAD